MSRTWKVSRLFIATMAIIGVVCIGMGLSLTLAPVAEAQAGLSTGSIQGTILDPKGSSVPAAKVSITSKATVRAFRLKCLRPARTILGPWFQVST